MLSAILDYSEGTAGGDVEHTCLASLHVRHLNMLAGMRVRHDPVCNLLEDCIKLDKKSKLVADFISRAEIYTEDVEVEKASIAACGAVDAATTIYYTLLKKLAKHRFIGDDFFEIIAINTQPVTVYETGLPDKGPNMDNRGSLREGYSLVAMHMYQAAYEEHQLIKRFGVRPRGLVKDDELSNKVRSNPIAKAQHDNALYSDAATQTDAQKRRQGDEPKTSRPKKSAKSNAKTPSTARKEETDDRPSSGRKLPWKRLEAEEPANRTILGRTLPWNTPGHPAASEPSSAGRSLAKEVVVIDESTDDELLDKPVPSAGKSLAQEVVQIDESADDESLDNAVPERCSRRF